MPQATYHAISLNLGQGPIEVTDDREVFLLSPHAKKEQRKNKARASGKPDKLASVGLQKCMSVPQTPLLAHRSSNAVEARPSDSSIDFFGVEDQEVADDALISAPRPSLKSPPHSLKGGRKAKSRKRVESGGSYPLDGDSSCWRSSRAAGSDGSRSDSSGGSSSSSSSASSSSSSSESSDDDPETQLDDGIKRRAGEQMMVHNLKLLAVKMRQYQPQDEVELEAQDCSPGDGDGRKASQARHNAKSAAKAFNQAYSRTLGILESNMTLSPPRRRHSVTFGDLRAYASTCGSEACSTYSSPPTPMNAEEGMVSRASSHRTPTSRRQRSMSFASSYKGSLGGFMSRTPSYKSLLEEPDLASEVCVSPQPSFPAIASTPDPAIKAIMEAFSCLDSFVAGTVPKQEFGMVLEALDPEVWTSTAVNKLLAAMNCDSNGRLDLAESLAWIFAGT